MKITLFVPCFVNHIYPEAAIAMVEILERLGHTVEYPQELTCCGQPAFNSGYWDETRLVADRVVDRLQDAENIVIASGSCGAMLKVFYPQVYAGREREAAARSIAAKTWEFCDFLVTKLGVTDLGARFPAKITYHDGCHGLRELGIKSQPRQLLAKVADLELVEMDGESCCGFGGTFAAKFPMISTAMGEVKCASALATKAEMIVSSDSSCLMHIQGLIDRQKLPIRTLHLAQILNSR